MNIMERTISVLIWLAAIMLSIVFAAQIARSQTLPVIQTGSILHREYIEVFTESEGEIYSKAEGWNIIQYSIYRPSECHWFVVKKNGSEIIREWTCPDNSNPQVSRNIFVSDDKPSLEKVVFDLQFLGGMR